MASVLDGLKSQVAKARDEYKSKKKAIADQIVALEKQSAQLDRDYAVLDTMMGQSGRKSGARRSATMEYGGVRTAVLDAVKSAKNGIMPKDIVAKTGLTSPQVHNALTGLKKDREVKSKDRLYHAT
jgi:hypothetical protein